MANKRVDAISLKVLVDKKKNRVIFAECDPDFVDILFRFLTTPIGTIARLTFTNSLTMEMGCMNNLYHSVKNMDVQHFRTEGYKAKLLSPHNGAESYCKNLKLRIDNTEATKFFHCSPQCATSNFKLLSHYTQVLYDCGNLMKYQMSLSAETASKDGGVFVKELNRYMISEDLQVMPLCAAASIAIMSKSGVSDWSTVYHMGVNEVL